MDRDVEALKIYCPNKNKNGCGWIGEIARVEDHLRGCKITCSKCKQIVHFRIMKSHLHDECPCYCPCCDVTAEREVISREHKDKCHRLPLTHTNNTELQETMRKEVVESLQIAKECSEKNDKQSDTTIINQLRSYYIAIAALVMAILIAIIVQSNSSLHSLHNRLEEDTDMHEQSFIALEQQNTLINEAFYEALLANLDQLSSSVCSTEWLSSELSNQIAPVIVEVPSFNEKLMYQEEGSSKPFFAFEEGYQMYLQLYTAGYGKGKGTHVSVSLVLMKGPYDDKLEQSGHWPLRGIFTIELLNQLNDSDHYSRIVQFHDYICNECTNRVLDKANSGIGNPWFISHDTLLHHSNNRYHKNDCLIFRITYEDMEAPYQVAPVTFKVTKFSQWLKSTTEPDWPPYSSPPFFAYERGYQMLLVVNPANNINGEGTHVSVALGLMKGPYDDELEESGLWPLRGTFIIELLNQLNDSDHYSRIIQFHNYQCSKSTNRVLESTDHGAIVVNPLCGRSHFISHDTLLHYSNNSYHKRDCLIFRITYEDLEDTAYRVAPVTLKVTKFSQWLKSTKDCYTSPPFFAYEGGYQMFLDVYAAGNGDGEGSHVSVYLHLMKGPYDDKLEQLGHWPLRGTFTIELLNQLNDSDHYIRILQFHHNKCSNCTNRVLESAEAIAGWGESQYMSHDTLLHHSSNSYYKSDSLIFRITYEDIEAPYQVAPVTFKITKFSHWLKSTDNWQSSPFFAFKEGFQFYLKVNATGYEGTHVSLYLYLMRGPYDDELEQLQLKGMFTIELLNQLYDSDHHSSTVKFDATRSVNEEYVDESVMIEAMDKYISHTTLFQHNNSYLKDDMLTFRISYSKGN